MNEMKLADLRKKAGLSQAQVSERIGLSKSQVSRIEALYPQVMFKTLRAYMDAIGADIRFTKDGDFDVVSGDIEADTTRIYAETRRKDPTRGGQIVRSKS